MKTGDNCIKWLMENYYISYKDYVGTQVYAKIKNAFDAMVKELLWPYDKKRLCCSKLICAKLNVDS